MAQVKRDRSLARRVKDVLSASLSLVGIDGNDVKIQTETVPGTRLVRVLITARQFQRLQPSERQKVVWRIIEQNFSPEEQLQLSLIVTLTPDELRAA